MQIRVLFGWTLGILLVCTSSLLVAQDSESSAAAAKQQKEEQQQEEELEELAKELEAAEESGPYDVIVITGSLPKIGEKLKRQLKMGGRLFAVAGDSPAMEAVLITRVGDYQWREEVIFETDLKRLETPDATGGFVF